MTLRGSISIGLVVLASLIVGTHARADGEEKTVEIVSHNTTSFGSAPFNFDGDGVANFAWFNGDAGKWGKIIGQGISQSALTGAGCTLPSGVSGFELHLVDHVAVTRFERTGSLLYERGKPGDLVACIDFNTGVFHEEGTVEIIGGTGMFQGAHGSYHAVQEGQVLVPPGSQKLQFGFANATYTYTLTYPK